MREREGEGEGERDGGREERVDNIMQIQFCICVCVCVYIYTHKCITVFLLYMNNNLQMYMETFSSHRMVKSTRQSQSSCFAPPLPFLLAQTHR